MSMNLREEIQKEHSKKQTNKIIRYVSESQKKFDALMDLFLEGEYRATQRAGWPLGYIAVAHPRLIEKHLEKLLLNLKKQNLHNAVIRNTFRLMQFVEIPKPLHSLAIDTCFKFFNDKKQPVAVRCFSMTVLANLCKKYPEMKHELKISIEESIPHAMTGFLARARRTLKEIS